MCVEAKYQIEHPQNYVITNVGPKINNDAGRDHWPGCYSVLLAGGGVRAGFSYGATDEFGHEAVENRMHMHDMHATILYALGIDHERLTYRHAGRDFRLTDIFGNIVHDVLT